MLIAGPCKAACDQVFHQLNSKFPMKHLGSPRKFLGLHISCDSASILIHQAPYIGSVLDRFRMMNCVPAQTPLDPTLPLLLYMQLHSRIGAINISTNKSWVHSIILQSIDSILAQTSLSLSHDYRSSTKILPKRISKLHIMFFAISNTLSIFALRMATPRLSIPKDSLTMDGYQNGQTPLIHKGLQMLIGEATRTTSSLQPDTCLSSTTALFHGPLTSNPPSHYQRMKPNIWLSPTRLAKQSHAHNSSKILISRETYLPYTLTTKQHSLPLFQKYPTIAQSILQYVTTSFAMSTTNPTLQSTISLPKINLQTCSQKHYIPPRIRDVCNSSICTNTQHSHNAPQGISQEEGCAGSSSQRARPSS